MYDVNNIQNQKMEIKSTNIWNEFCRTNKRSKNLVYTTIGFSKSYIQCIELFLTSILAYSTPLTFDVLVICDEEMFNEVSDIAYSIFDDDLLRNKIFFLVAPDSVSAMKASMHKLHVFDFPQLNTYENVTFIDIDVLCIHDLNAFFENMNKCIESMKDVEKEPDSILFAHNERDDPSENRTVWWCMNDYTDEEMEFFKQKRILPFNAGMFAFRYSESMKKHFSNVLKMIDDSPRVYFFEQAYMNAYFNRRHFVRYNLITKDNYVLFPDVTKLYEKKLIHFCGHPGNGRHKYQVMKEYAMRFNLLTFGEKKENKENKEEEEDEEEEEKGVVKKGNDTDMKGYPCGFRHHVIRNRKQIIL